MVRRFFAPGPVGRCDRPGTTGFGVMATGTRWSWCRAALTGTRRPDRRSPGPGAARRRRSAATRLRRDRAFRVPAPPCPMPLLHAEEHRPGFVVSRSPASSCAWARRLTTTLVCYALRYLALVYGHVPAGAEQTHTAPEPAWYP